MMEKNPLLEETLSLEENTLEKNTVKEKLSIVLGVIARNLSTAP